MIRIGCYAISIQVHESLLCLITAISIPVSCTHTLIAIYSLAVRHLRITNLCLFVMLYF